uniref:Pentacotripeptide-repeat region of PRORP domain-containing protein n=1 Tax=Spongospora subterranea TaxID=70186 RepID=A0A0H5R9P1_9EUKA|eukprot:CRZ10845.1 hypothetical protein [Spongospora subterranea]
MSFLKQIRILVRQGQLGQAETLLWIKPDREQYHCVVQGYARRRNLKKCLWIMQQMKFRDLHPTDEINISLCVAQSFSTDWHSRLTSLLSLASTSCSTNQFNIVCSRVMKPICQTSKLSELGPMIDDLFHQYNRAVPYAMHQHIVKNLALSGSNEFLFAINRLRKQGYHMCGDVCDSFVIWIARHPKQVFAPTLPEFRSEMPKNLWRDVVLMWNSGHTVTCLKALKCSHQALMIDLSIPIANAFLNSAARKGQVEITREIIKILLKTHVRPTIRTFNTLLLAYARSNSYEKCLCLVVRLLRLQHPALCPDLHTYTIMIEISQTQAECKLYLQYARQLDVSPDALMLTRWLASLSRFG